MSFTHVPMSWLGLPSRKLPIKSQTIQQSVILRTYFEIASELKSEKSMLLSPSSERSEAGSGITYLHKMEQKIRTRE